MVYEMSPWIHQHSLSSLRTKLKKNEQPELTGFLAQVILELVETALKEQYGWTQEQLDEE